MILFIYFLLFSTDFISIEDLNTCMNLLVNNEQIVESTFYYCEFCGSEEKVGVIVDQLIVGENLPIEYPSELSISMDKGSILRDDLNCYATYLPVYFRIDTISIIDSKNLSISFRITNDHFIERSKRKSIAGSDFEYYKGKAQFFQQGGWKIKTISLNEEFVRGDFCNSRKIDYNFYNKLMQNINNTSYKELVHKHDSLLSIGQVIDFEELNYKLDSLIKIEAEIIIDDF